MKTTNRCIRLFSTATVVAAIMILSTSASALDAAYSRKGGFTGIGLGGGVAILGGAAAGDIGMNLQAGIGTTDKMTIAFNLDTRLQVNNDIIQGMIVPGPELSFFVTKNLYIHAGAGLTMAFSNEASGVFIGMDAGAGIGYEHFVNTNLAAYISMDIDYFLINDANDSLTIGLWVGIRYY